MSRWAEGRQKSQSREQSPVVEPGAAVWVLSPAPEPAGKVYSKPLSGEGGQGSRQTQGQSKHPPPPPPRQSKFKPWMGTLGTLSQQAVTSPSPPRMGHESSCSLPLILQASARHTAHWAAEGDTAHGIGLLHCPLLVWPTAVNLLAVD